MSGAEAAARRTAAAAALADFRREADGTVAPVDWLAWAHRLAGELDSLLQPDTSGGPDGLDAARTRDGGR